MSDGTTDFNVIKKLHREISTILMHLKLIQGDVKLIREHGTTNAREMAGNAWGWPDY